MPNYSLTHVSDAALLRGLADLVQRERMTTADLLAHIAEVDSRKLFVPAGYPSMHAYCVEELRLSEDAAFRRIRAARAARQFPILFEATAEGRLHLAAVSLLAPHLTSENVAELIAMAVHRRKSEIEEFLARRFGPTEATSVVRPLIVATGQLVPGRVEGPVELVLGRVGDGGSDQDTEEPRAVELVPGRVEAPANERFLVQLTVGRSAYEKLRRAQERLSHAVPSGDVAEVFERALDLLVTHLEKRKAGATVRPRKPRLSVRKRHIPAHVRRAVWDRDEGRCTFVSVEGNRCAARRLLEFDHVEPVARGGTATVDGLRLRCRAHNQYEAERVFGAEFMKAKRRARHPERPQHAPGHVRRPPEVTSPNDANLRDILAGLENLGCRPGDARRAAEYSVSLPVSTLEERMRAALRFLGSSSRACRRPVPSD